ncbi:DUF3987 domain-containing protein [Mesorhizobium sp. ESP6-5]|uniref:DUF3987 domain-containing protein n=1 Tax=Mesorhizobium sp. ESP6-5 TaxID=2876623 RepID=UPI001CCC2EDD|nr:DUF3987 domain-containing protein [Mesorhizobium sp. ESP6-5]MBZ9758426.1 DUF3987 domain-containing protein [Mesorhizobium sp. ESP6-5]
MSVAHISLNFHRHRPPGLIGEIYDFILSQAPHPIHEVALAGAIALFAGIVGRQFNFSDDGLNQYILLVADTGMGKDAAKAGMSKILGKLAKKRPAATNIMGPADFASGPALVKSIARRSYPCFVCVAGEVGIKLQQMANPRSSEHSQTLKRELLKLFTLSGAGRILEPYEYSDRKETTSAIMSPAFTLLGEGTGATVYEALDDTQVTNGLISRFTIIEYAGLCPEYNKGHQFALVSEPLVAKLDELYHHVSDLAQNEQVTVVGINPDAEGSLNAIREHARAVINSKSGEVVNNIWTRVAQKAGRLAALLAVAHNWQAPVITGEMIEWAASLVLTDTQRLSAKFEAGEMGTVDITDNEKQIDEIKKVIRKYLSREADQISDLKLRIMVEKKVIQYSYIHRSVAKLKPFATDKRKATAAIKSTLISLCEMGRLREIRAIFDKGEKFEHTTNSGKTYEILNLKWVLGLEDGNVDEAVARKSPQFWNS